jgi:hypothetical protein
VSEGYIPEHLRPLVGLGRRLFPFIGGDGYSVKIGPFPKGMPIGLITNVDILGSELPPDQQKAHRERLLTLFKRAKRELKSGADIGTALKGLVDDMLAVSKCKDLVLNKGHYFGTSQFTSIEPGEPGLSDTDKRALIALIKTF